MRVLALVTYPSLAAATRHRVLQYVPLLANDGVVMDVRPFLSNRTFAGLYDRRRALMTVSGIGAGIARRILDVRNLDRYDLVFVQGMAALVGPPVVEWLAQRKRPLVVDLDDATYIERESEVFGRLAALLKGRNKANRLLRWADYVVCGNPTIADYAASHYGKATEVLPTIVDVDLFRPREGRSEGGTVIGWMGTHSTFPYLAGLTGVFRTLARSHKFTLRIIGAGSENVRMEGVTVEALPWTLDRELADLQSFDIGVYPLVSDPWAEAKSGFKAIQYLSCGIPYVASPVGVVASIGTPGVTHLTARTDGEWIDALSSLLAAPAMRAEMAKSGREYAVAHYSVGRSARALKQVFVDAVAHRQQGLVR